VTNESSFTVGSKCKHANYLSWLMYIASLCVVRRALPWDPNMGDEAGELDSFVRYLVMRLLNSLKGKALNYTKDGRDDSQVRKG
jgi:hypothetical protein